MDPSRYLSWLLEITREYVSYRDELEIFQIIDRIIVWNDSSDFK